VQAQVAQVTLGEPLGRLGDEHLPAVARRHDPGGSVHVHADITVLADKRLAGVDPDSNANRPLSQRRLPRRCRGQCILHTPERDEQRVALRVHLHPGVRGERLPQHPPMLRQHFRVRLGPELVQQSGRTLDIGEEERDGAGRECSHRGARQRSPASAPTGLDEVLRAGV